MADLPFPRLCLGVPIDHRLEPLLGTGLTTPDPFVSSGYHAREIESYGRRLQNSRGTISDDEINFAKWLALPETKGGVVIVLQQPAEHQRYFSNHHHTVKDCDTLDAVDEVCKAVVGYGLEKISCFDAFPFYKIPVSKSLDKHEEELDEAYRVFLHMIETKQPDVVFCCYRSPHSTKYKDFQCIGIGLKRDSPVTVQGQRYTCVNGFHPSYALNYLEDKSALRTLYIMEATQAFCRANGTWRERSWMMEVRENCAAIVREDWRGKQNHASWTKHDFQRERFQSYMELIESMFDSLISRVYDDMTNDELYNVVLKKRYNVLLSNCLLLLVKINNFEERGGHRLQNKGFSLLRQREERDVRDLRRNVEKRCNEFLHSLCEAPSPVENGGTGLFTSADLNKCLLPLGPFKHQSGFHYDFRLNFLKMAHGFNSAYTYQGRGVYDPDRNTLARAFELAARHLEWALAQHTANIQRRVPEEDLAIVSRLSLLTINSSIQQTKHAACPKFSQTRTALAPSPPYLQTPLLTSSRRSTEASAPPLSRTAAWPSTPAAPRFGIASPSRSPYAASSSKYRSAPTCTECKQTGHSSPSCPKTKCYRCKYPTVEDGSVLYNHYYGTES